MRRFRPRLTVQGVAFAIVVVAMMLATSTGNKALDFVIVANLIVVALGAVYVESRSDR